MQVTSSTSSEITAQIQQRVPVGSSEPGEPALLEELTHLTQKLIQEYQASGRLQSDPFDEVWTRSIYLYKPQICDLLKNQSVLVTGGEGFVGTCLIEQLLKLGVNHISSIDNARCTNTGDLQPIFGQASNVTFYAADVRDINAVRQVFEREKPAIVFHLAAIRIPGLAEKIIHETVTSNIFGTQNIIQVCEEFNVRYCIFSSTGKSSRYWTAEVYAATKKVNEWLFAEAAQRGKVQYGMVRFTHMLNNSSMCEQIDQKIQADRPINIHAPERYVVGQNVEEAVCLLLNALVFSRPKRLRFLLVRNLGWPVESLEVALYKILQSGKKLPIYFQGIPPGYEEPFFLGQVDWNYQTEINTLVNALETYYFREVSSSGDMIVSEMVPFAIASLTEQLCQLRSLCACPAIAPTEIKQKLADVVRNVALSQFSHAPISRRLEILQWGIDLKHYEQGELDLISYQPYIELLVQSLSKQLSLDVLQTCKVTLQDFEHLISAVSIFPSLQHEVEFMKGVARGRAGERSKTGRAA